ncbi:ATP-binding protein [Motilibacter peucedani]|uniref:ATP-binding protein n=1 Tax=Motilibacter peucedani TaxID=598650 RepID=UPI000EADC9D1|nr:ATP-binding protein [Motilibacter peucedani]
MLTSEALRLSALHEYGLLDSPADDELEAVVRLAAAVAGASSATLNLIDEDRQCQLTTVGFEGGDSPRSDSMCALRLLEARTVWTPDASSHPDYATNPWVTGRLAAVRFYASVPLVTPGGFVLGTLCVFDTVVRRLSDAQVRLLEDAAGVVVALFERRRQARENRDLAMAADEQRELLELTMRELEVRQELTDAVLDTIDVGVVAAGPDGRLTLFNRAARDWLGTDLDATVAPEEHAARYALFAADGRTPLTAEDAPLQRALRTGRVDGAEIVVAPAGRAPARFTVSGRALAVSDGSSLGAVVAMTDVTHDREQRAALEAAHAQLAERTRELERSNGELEQFAATASHDLRSPLSVVDGYLELLDDVHGEALGEQGRGWVGTARRALARTLTLTDALLSYAQAGGASCARLPVDLGEVLEHAVLDLRHEVRAAGASVEAPAPLPVVYGDATLLRQLLQNLVGNAIKHRHPDRPSQVCVTAERGEGGWVVSVADNGVGIPAEARERVFAMFSTLDPASRTGHGVGLSTCKRIVERHGGRIWISEAPGGGAVVQVALPQR